MTNTPSSRPPAGVGGKDTSTLDPNGGSGSVGGNAGRLANSVAGSSRRSQVVILTAHADIIRENEACQARNDEHTDRRHTTSDDVLEDEEPLDVPDDHQRPLPDPKPVNTHTPLINWVKDFHAFTPTSMAVAQAIVGSNTQAAAPVAQGAASSTSGRIYDDAQIKIASSINNIYEIPQVVINLANSGLHVPLMLLTAATIERMHTDPSCITMKKGLVLSDLKKSVLDTSAFPAESTITPVEFYEASENFMELLKIIGGPSVIEKFTAHRQFCLARRRFSNHFDAVVAFDIETRRLFFTTKTFLLEAAYEWRWNDTLMMVSHVKSEESSANTNKEVARLSALAARIESGGGSSSCYQPYPQGKPKSEGGGTSLNSDGNKSFRKGKGASSDGPLCLICGRNGHKAGDCTHTVTVKNAQPVCMWQDKLILKSSSAIICISYNIGRCIKARHGDDVIHVCSVCGSKSHAAVARSC